jgi:hypothetical protein
MAGVADRRAHFIKQVCLRCVFCGGLQGRGVSGGGLYTD